MTGLHRSILTINGGSSSIKFALFDAIDGLPLRLTGRIENIATQDAVFSVERTGPGPGLTRRIPGSDYAAAVAALLDWIAEQEKEAGLIAVGHRVVHGGPHYHAPQRVDAALLAGLHALVPVDPAHLPGEIMMIEQVGRRFPQLAQVACFDTAFHHDLPRVARLLPIPLRYEAQGVRRYGFHGLSYEYLMGELVRIGGGAAGSGRVVLAHLGNGASLSAVRGGKPIDTSMGFTPAAGVPMGSRSGDLDPGLPGYLARTEGLNPKQFNDMVNGQSGLLGLSETSADMRELMRREVDDPRARDAVALFCYQVRKWIGAFAAALGGIDTLIFAGGIGENAAVVRSRICSGLEFLGIEIDADNNHANAAVISPVRGQVTVRVMRTNEELVLARAVYGLVQGGAPEPVPSSVAPR